MANYKISQLPAYDQPVAADDLLAAVDTSFGTTKKLTTAQLFTDAGLTGLTTADSIDFNAGAAGGELSWNNQEKTLDLVTGSDNVTLQLGQEVTLYARNNSGATMSDGQVVMISGSQGNNPTIALAQADTVENARKTIGVVTQVIPNNSNGFVTLIGKVRDLVLDNGTYTEGDVVYLSDTVAGGLTAVEPAIKVDVGHVLATSNGGNTNGVLEVQMNNNAGTGGTVSSVSVTGGTGITSTGSPVTSSGTINVELDAATQATLSNVATNTADIAINTAKVGITPTQASDITTNNAKVGITTAQAADIVTNNAKVGITTAQASDITTNNAKVGITPAQASEINTALQPADPTLDSVTDNGSTTTNNVTVGSKFATGNNVATGGAAIAIGGVGNTASGSNSDIIGSDNSTASGLGSTIVGGSNITNAANWSAALGGLNQSVATGGARSAIIGGFNHNMNHADSVILGGSNITTDSNNTVFVPSLNVGAGFKMPTGAADSYILTSNATGAGTWQANEKVGNDTTGEAAGSDSVLNMVSLTQAEYDTALANFPATIKATTLYIIKP